jgi:hypothetical protein
MATYGDPNIYSACRRKAVSGPTFVFTATFTTAGASNPTVDSAKTRGVISVLRTGTGTIDITLPYALRNVCVTLGLNGGTTAQIVRANQVEGTAVCNVSTVTAGGTTAADSTGIIVTVRIEGTGR